jgi:hypothetical protein
MQSTRFDLSKDKAGKELVEQQYHKRLNSCISAQHISYDTAEDEIN